MNNNSTNINMKVSKVVKITNSFSELIKPKESKELEDLREFFFSINAV